MDDQHRHDEVDATARQTAAGGPRSDPGTTERADGRWRKLIDRWRHRWNRWVANSVEAPLSERVTARIPGWVQTRRGRIMIAVLALVLVAGWGTVLIVIIS